MVPIDAFDYGLSAEGEKHALFSKIQPGQPSCRKMALLGAAPHTSHLLYRDAY
jgi:hypothetical protein